MADRILLAVTFVLQNGTLEMPPLVRAKYM
jgi:hypothetical protein